MWQWEIRGVAVGGKGCGSEGGKGCGSEGGKGCGNGR